MRRAALTLEPGVAPACGTSILAQRVAAVDASTVLVAAGRRVYRLKLPERSAEATAGAAPAALGDVAVTAHWDLEHEAARHGTSIETIVVRSHGGVPVATAVDGDGQVWQFPAVEGAQVPAPWTAPSHVADHGWAGVDVHPADGNMVASARYYQRSIALHTGGVCTRVAHLPTPPHRIHYAATGQLYVVAGPSVLVWDPRVSEHGGIVDRAKAHSAGRLYAIATSATTVAVAGEDRTVVAYDVRKLSNVLGTWSSCLKNDVAWLAFRPGDDRYCYVSGAVDSELACGSWDTKLDRLNHLGNANVRVDGRWIGMDMAPDRDTLVGVTVHNSLYTLDDAGGFFRELHRLARASESADPDTAVDLKRNRLDLDPHDM